MKRSICFIIFFQLFTFSIFCQHQELETLDEVMIGPHNVDIHYLEQVKYYIEKYNGILEYLTELEMNHQLDLEKLAKKKKSKIWRKNQIKKEVNMIGLLQTDIEVVEDYLFLWKNSKIGLAHVEFEKEYDSKFCYEISSINKIYFPFEYRVEEEDRGFIEWREMIPNEHIKEVEETKLVKHTGHKWVKKRADKNCLSNDPKDCMVWCLMKIPPEFQTEKYYDGVTPDFELSEDKEFLIRKFEIEISETKQYKLIDTLNDFEIEIESYKKVSCN